MEAEAGSLFKEQQLSCIQERCCRFPPTLPGGPKVQHPSGGPGAPEAGWWPVKSNPGPCKDSSVQGWIQQDLYDDQENQDPLGKASAVDRRLWGDMLRKP